MSMLDMLEQVLDVRPRSMPSGVGTLDYGGLASVGTAFGSIAGGMSADFARRALSGILGPLSGALTRDIEYAANVAGPTVIPSVESLMKLYWSGFITRNMLVRFGACHGADFRDFATRRRPQFPRAEIWRQLLESHRPNYPIAMLRKLSRQGVRNADQLLLRALEREGFSDPAEQGLFIDEYNPLDAHSLMLLFFRQEITEQQLYDGLKVLGWRRQDAERIASISHHIADAGLLRDLRYRGLLTQEEQAAALYRQGYANETVQQMLNVQWRVPELSTIYALRNTGLIGNDDAAVTAMKAIGWDDSSDNRRLLAFRFAQPSLGDVLLQGNRIVAGTAIDRFREHGTAIPQFFKEWAKRLGHGMSTDNTQAYGTEDDNSNWAINAWNNQWQLPSVGMLAQFLHRFRGDPQQQSTWSFPGVQPLTLDEANAILTANGIADSLKPYVYNLMYSPLNLRHIQLIVRYLPVNTAQVASWLQDNGISPQQSQVLAAAYLEKRQEEIQKPIVVQRQQALRKLQASIEAAYGTGTLDHDTALAELAANGLDPAAAATVLASIDVHVANTLSNEVIKRARSDVFAGIVQIGSVAPRLIQAGIAPPRVAQLVATWTAQLSMGRKTLGTDKILRYLRKGFISRDAAMVRLNNLGWSGTDLLLLLHDVQATIASDTAKTIAAGEREKVQEERAIERQINRIGTLFDSLVSRLKTLTPPAKIVKWYKSGLWSEDRARKRLRQLLYTDDVIDTMLLEALGTSSKPAVPKGGGK